ncbi:MAG: acetolactate synthase large subunit, partial [Firmicutes bacterium]|nr:acetolactate synthase large subunit [Bacillota bacterium]
TVLNRKTDFVKLAQAFGAKAQRVSSVEEFKEAFAEGMQQDGPFLIDIAINMDEFVLPMMPPGGSIEDLITSREQEG